MPRIHKFIVCNGAEILIEHNRLTGKWGGEQCEGCGGDIAEHGEVITRSNEVVCDNCDALYDIKQLVCDEKVCPHDC